MEQNLDNLGTDTSVSMKIIYELGMGKKFCRELDKSYLRKHHCKNAYRLKNTIKKIFMKLLALRND